MRVAARKNRLLAALPDAALRRWLPRMTALPLKLGQRLVEPGALPRHAWFPSTTIVSMLYGGEKGAPAEVAMVGREGVVGLPIFMGGEPSPGLAVVQAAGWGFRLDAEAMRDECGRDWAVMQLLLRYTQVLMAQTAQTAICNRRHALDQQLCRYLLQCLDRVDGDELAMTHEQIARMLGVRRGGVTQCALDLQEAGAIRYARGRITVLDRAALEARACPCYEIVRREYERLYAAAG